MRAIHARGLVRNTIVLIVFSANPHFDSAQCSSATATLSAGFGILRSILELRLGGDCISHIAIDGVVGGGTLVDPVKRSVHSPPGIGVAVTLLAGAIAAVGNMAAVFRNDEIDRRVVSAGVPQIIGQRGVEHWIVRSVDNLGGDGEAGQKV